MRHFTQPTRSRDRTYLSAGATTEVRLKSTGGSWIGSHQHWQEGDLRQQVLAAVEQLSQDYAKVVESGEGSDEKSRALLLCETSCFVYWGSDFWAQQAKLFIEWARGIV
ncbi:hypothetical protein [Moorena sp. SIO4G3]|uniref:hypothetical protein n=1 Tax=Moorena sp. SIO4G3 TaxID=2607821 RepID=UPI0025D50B44|nr:hypothetical protein [Moorena sp. SIO4G3]